MQQHVNLPRSAQILPVLKSIHWLAANLYILHCARSWIHVKYIVYTSIKSLLSSGIGILVPVTMRTHTMVRQHLLHLQQCKWCTNIFFCSTLAFLNSFVWVIITALFPCVAFMLFEFYCIIVLNCIFRYLLSQFCTMGAIELKLDWSELGTYWLLYFNIKYCVM